jgi:predicted NBD/HSP70 family sugar kinase
MAKDLRQVNRRRVLDVLLSRVAGGATQPDIEEATRLSRASVTAILMDLEPILRPKNGSVELAESRGGRPARLFHLRDDIGAIGIDFGRSHVRVGMQRLTGMQPAAADIVSWNSLDLDIASQPDAALDLATELINSLLARPEAPTEIAGLCVGLAAPVDTRGRVRMGAFQAWADLDLRSELLERLNQGLRTSSATPRVLINNDANLALKAELRWGAAQGVENAVYLKWSTGIGLASCVDAKVLRGHGGIAGEIGHTAVWDSETDGECRWCGRHCLETVASLEALYGSASELVEIAKDLEHPEHDRLEEAVENAASLIGRTLAPVVNALNPRVIVVGGMCPELFPKASLEPLREAVEESVFPSIGRDVRIRASSQTLGPVVCGALAAVFDETFPDYLIELAER